jgi:hypothetical protein
MVANKPTGPTMSQIRETQNAEDSLRSRIAANHFYQRASWIHFGGASLTIILALASPFVLLFRPGWGPMLGAIAGAWIFASRIVLEPAKRDFQLKGATAQERFDCAVLALDWNDSLVRRLSEEEVRAASRSMKNREKSRDWYPAQVELAWPRSVLLCQRANTVWARRQHRWYARVVIGLTVGWAVFGVLTAVLHSASLGEYLVTILLPSLPAFLDASELSRVHAAAASARQLVEDQADAFFQSGSPSHQDLREIQDQLFNLRREAPLVPQWFYKMIRPGFEEDMQFAAEQLAKRDTTDGQGDP